MFTGDGCQPCALAKPKFIEAANKYKNTFMIVDNTVMRLSEAEIGFRITGVPTFVRYKNKQPVNRSHNFADLKKIK